MRDRQQNSTSYPMPFFMVYSTDHQTGKPGLSPAVTISKNGAGFGAPSGAVSEIGNGWYSLAGNATDRATLGSLIIHASATGADTTDTQFRIVPWDPYDAVRMGLTALPNVASGSNGAIITQGDGTAQLNVSGGKAPATMAAADVSGNLPTNVTQWLGQAVTAQTDHTPNVYATGGSIAVALSVLDIQKMLRSAYKTSGNIWHVWSGGNNSDGLSWQTAFNDLDTLIGHAAHGVYGQGGWNALDLITGEVYPTTHRSSALGLLGAAGRLASFATTSMAAAVRAPTPACACLHLPAPCT